MSVPKQRHSNRRQARGRIRYNKKPKTLASCAKCGSPALPHRVCPACETYRGRSYGKSVPTPSKKAAKPSKKTVARAPKKKSA